MPKASVTVGFCYLKPGIWSYILKSWTWLTLQTSEEIHQKYIVRSTWVTTKHHCNLKSVHVQYPETTNDMHYLHVLILEQLVISLSEFIPSPKLYTGAPQRVIWATRELRCFRKTLTSSSTSILIGWLLPPNPIQFVSDQYKNYCSHSGHEKLLVEEKETSYHRQKHRSIEVEFNLVSVTLPTRKPPKDLKVDTHVDMSTDACIEWALTCGIRSLDPSLAHLQMKLHCILHPQASQVIKPASVFLLDATTNKPENPVPTNIYSQVFISVTLISFIISYMLRKFYSPTKHNW